MLPRPCWRASSRNAHMSALSAAPESPDSPNSPTCATKTATPLIDPSSLDVAQQSAAETGASAAASAVDAAPEVAGSGAGEVAGEVKVAVEHAPAAPAIPDLPPAVCAARLAELFPALFAPPAKPIKLRIHTDIQLRAPGIFNKRSLSIFLHRHTTSTAYLRALATAPQRVDLDGNAAGDIAEEHRSAAATELARRKEIVEARRADERALQQERRREEQRAIHIEAQRAAKAAVRREEARDDQARRDRAALLRAYDASSITRANFCVLKGISETELEAQLQLAKQDATQRPEMSQPTLTPGPRGPAPRRDDRGRANPRGPQGSRREGGGQAPRGRAGQRRQVDGGSDS